LTFSVLSTLHGKSFDVISFSLSLYILMCWIIRIQYISLNFENTVFTTQHKHNNNCYENSHSDYTQSITLFEMFLLYHHSNGGVLCCVMLCCV
jgi:hypothetical protein